MGTLLKSDEYGIFFCITPDRMIPSQPLPERRKKKKHLIYLSFCSARVTKNINLTVMGRPANLDVLRRSSRKYCNTLRSGFLRFSVEVFECGVWSVRHGCLSKTNQASISPEKHVDSCSKKFSARNPGGVSLPKQG